MRSRRPGNLSKPDKGRIVKAKERKALEELLKKHRESRTARVLLEKLLRTNTLSPRECRIVRSTFKTGA